MSDVRIKELFSLDGPTMDWFLRDTGELDEREELATAVRLALGTDALAATNEILPDPDSIDRRGWWADMDAEAIWGGWPIGCKNWLLTRTKIMEAPSSEGSTLQRAKQYTQQALQPFIDKRIATQIEVQAARTELGRIEVHVIIYRGPKAEIDLRYQLLWEEEVAEDFPIVALVDTKIRVPYANLKLSSDAVAQPLLSENRNLIIPQGNLELSSVSFALARIVPQGNVALSSVPPSIFMGFKRTALQGNIVVSPTAPSVVRTNLFVGDMGTNGQTFNASNVITLTGGSSWTVPSDCALIDSVECIGAGAPGSNSGSSPGDFAGGPGGDGGGGAAYARKNNVTVTPGSAIGYSIGLNSAATNFGGVCVAAGASGINAGTAAASTGDVRNSGANGGAGQPASGTTGGNGGAGGAGGSPFGGAGGAGGGGVGTDFTNGFAGGAGSPYGSGGGGGGGGGIFSGSSSGGAQYQGLLRITYTSKLFMTTTATAPAGSTVIVGITLNTNNGVTVASLSDGTNSYTKIDSTGLIGGVTEVSLWYKSNLAAPLSSGSQITVTLSGAATGSNNSCMIDAAYATGVTATPLDKFAHVSASSGTSVSIATGTLTQALELVFGYGGDISGLGSTVYNGASGFNNVNKASAVSQGVTALDWKIVNATTTVTFGPSWGSATRMGAVVASLKG